jgi:hypothetical protein
MQAGGIGFESFLVDVEKCIFGWESYRETPGWEQREVNKRIEDTRSGFERQE